MAKEKEMIKEYYKKYVRQYKMIFVGIFILSIITNILTLANPFLNGFLIDYALQSNYSGLKKVLCIMLLLFLINALLSLVYTYMRNYLTNKLTNDIKQVAFGKILFLKMESFDKNTIGKYMSFLDGDIGVISGFYVSSINSFLICIVKLIVSSIFILTISVKLSLIGLAALPIMLFINVKFGKVIKKLQEKNRKTFDLYTSTIQEAFSGIREIKGLVLEKVLQKKNEKILEQNFNINIKLGLISSFGGFAQVTTGFLMQIAVFFTGCIMIAKKQLLVGRFSSFNSYLDEFLTALREITGIHISIQNVLVSMNRFEELINNCSSESVCINEQELIESNIEFNKVCFGYNERKIINNLNFEIKENELVALVGANGSGKTTALNLLIGFYNNYEGEILIGGKKLEEIELYTLRRGISYIQQQPFLFNDTIRNNLTIGLEDYEEDAIIDVCKQVKLYEYIEKLPDGLDTVIGERGKLLSGGQKQQLAIARGLLRKSKIFLLDEITSNIDGDIEKRIIKVIYELSINHTVIMIAHRMSSIVDIPKIIVMDEGRKVDQGTHGELIERCLEYKKLFSLDIN